MDIEDGLKHAPVHSKTLISKQSFMASKYDQWEGSLANSTAANKIKNRTKLQSVRLGLYVLFAVALLDFCLKWVNGGWDASTSSANEDPSVGTLVMADDVCKQADVLGPTQHEDLFRHLDQLFETESFKFKAYESLGGAVRVPTETYDDIGAVGEDSRWEIFDSMHQYLAERYPLLHLNLTVTKVNSYALVYHWQGSDVSLKPVLMAAHQDVVPVDNDTLSQWIQPPFSGYYDGEWIWGRGSCDDKSGLVGILTAVETLLESGFQPTRTVVLAFGMDEERGGPDGAKFIAPYLESVYGQDGFSILIDEGGGYSELFGSTFAMPAVAEKGKLDIQMEVTALGGHSSVPPAHTTIGILARLITELEANPHPTHLHRDRTYYNMFLCLAEHSTSMPTGLRHLIKKSRTDDDALLQLESILADFMGYAPSTGTTQAVDIIGGGVKINALPERAFAIVNHRIADYSSVEELQSRFTSIVSPVAEQYNLSIDAFGSISNVATDAPVRGHLALFDAFDTGLQPAPVSPTMDSDPWDLLVGTIKYSLETSHRSGAQYKNANVAPGLAIGNTDTKYYWNLTKHIFRYNHRALLDTYNGAHTINEAMRAEGFLEMIRFYTLFILNTDETTLLP